MMPDSFDGKSFMPTAMRMINDDLESALSKFTALESIYFGAYYKEIESNVALQALKSTLLEAQQHIKTVVEQHMKEDNQ